MLRHNCLCYATTAVELDHWIVFNLPNPSSRAMDLEETQPSIEISTRILPEGKARPAQKADNYRRLWADYKIVILGFSKPYRPHRLILG
jgi:hypothetical protein